MNQLRTFVGEALEEGGGGLIRLRRNMEGGKV